MFLNWPELLMIVVTSCISFSLEKSSTASRKLMHALMH